MMKMVYLIFCIVCAFFVSSQLSIVVATDSEDGVVLLKPSAVNNLKNQLSYSTTSSSSRERNVSLLRRDETPKFLLSKAERRFTEEVCNAHSQLGSNIDNYETEELLSTDFSLSDDGMTVAIVPHTTTGNFTSKDAPYEGQVRVFKFNTEKSQWEQKGGIVTLSSGTTNDYGNIYTTVTLSGDGNVLAIAQHFVNDQMQLFRFDGSDWIQMGQNFTPGLTSPTSKEIALSKDSQTLLYINTDNYEASLKAFRYNATANEWKKMGEDVVLGDFDKYHKISLSSDGSTVATWHGLLNVDQGKFTVYSYNEITDKWEKKGDSVHVCDDKDNSNRCYFDDNAILTNDGETFIWNQYVDVDPNYAIIPQIYKYSSASNEWIKNSDATALSYMSEDVEYDSISIMQNEFSNDGMILAISGRDKSYDDEGATKYMKKVRIFSYDESDDKWTQLAADIPMEDFYPTFSLSGDGNHVALFINEKADFTQQLEPTYLKVFELCKTPSAAYLLPMKFATIGITLVMSTLLFV